MKKKNRRNFEKLAPVLVTDDMKLLLRGRDAAIVCGCTPRIWKMWDKLGYTPMSIRIGKAMFWRYHELLQWVDAECPRREEWWFLSP